MYQKKYGSLEGVCSKLSFNDIGRLANDVSKALTADVPSFVRLDETFPDTEKGASVAWLFSHLKNLLTTSGILKEKMSNEQVDILASIITANYPAMTLTEFMLFETYFLGGKYEEFYGETSYVMAITRSLNQFRKDLNVIYARIEREKQSVSEQDKTPGVSWEQYCKDNGMEGKPFPGSIREEPLKIRSVIRKPSMLTEVQVGVNTAHAVIDNIYKLDKTGVTQLRDAFRKRYGCWPEDYLKAHETVVEEK